MPTSEKFCLKWNDFQENVNTAFASLRKDNNFTDVTLAFEDGNQVEAHKVVLAASSPFFENLLKRNKHAHPLIYMRGLKSEDLIAILDFLYYGEAKIYQENLDNCLIIAEDIKLKGLNGEESNGENTQNQTNKHIVPSAGEQLNDDTNKSLLSQKNSENHIMSSMAVTLPRHEFSGDMKQLDVKIETMMCKGKNMISNGPDEMIKAYICQLCGKEGRKCDIKRHVEANHLEGITIPCSLCEKTFASRNSLRRHKLHFHENSN